MHAQSCSPVTCIVWQEPLTLAQIFSSEYFTEMGHVTLTRKAWGKAGKRRAAAPSPNSLSWGATPASCRGRGAHLCQPELGSISWTSVPCTFPSPFISLSYTSTNENSDQRQTRASVTTSKTKQVTQMEYLGAATMSGRTDRSAAIQKDNLESKAARTGVLCLPSGPRSPKQMKAYNKA